MSIITARAFPPSGFTIGKGVQGANGATSNNGKVLKAGVSAGSLSWQAIDWVDILNKPDVAQQIYAGNAAPSSPIVGMIWIDTN